MSEEQNIEIQDCGSLHRFRTEIPNIIFFLNLTDTEFRFYCELKRITGENGSCWASNKLLSLRCQISERTITDLKKILDEKKLITVTDRKKENGSRATSLIKIVDIWDENMDRFKNKGNDKNI